MELAPVGVQMTYANAGNAAQVQHNLNHASALQQDFQAVREKNDAELKQKQVRNKDDTEDGPKEIVATAVITTRAGESRRNLRTKKILMPSTRDAGIFWTFRFD